MAIKRTRWSPDTCGCVMTYEWDSATSESTRVHTNPVIEKACPAHQGFTTAQDHYDAVLAENQSKNQAVDAEAKRRGWVPPVFDPDTGDELVPQTNPQHAPHRIKWSFDQSRKVELR